VSMFDWMQNQTWRANAACRGTDPDMFHPHNERHETHSRSAEEVAAKRACKDCPVLRDCLDYAIDTGESLGIWGGMNRKERELERRRRGRER
jgi:WhiB family redox-sensing transcriptional regulator